jgi:hypothetical protein
LANGHDAEIRPAEQEDSAEVVVVKLDTENYEEENDLHTLSKGWRRYLLSTQEFLDVIFTGATG